MANSIFRLPINNYKTIQQKVFRSLTATGGDDSTGISVMPPPTAPGAYRVTSLVTGLPSGANAYGALLVFNCGSYGLYLYADAAHNFYYAEVGTETIPSKWYKLNGTEVNSTT